MAERLGLAFAPVLEERLDLLVWRRAYFEPQIQRLLGFLAGPEAAARAASMGGYDLRAVGAVRFNVGGD